MTEFYNIILMVIYEGLVLDINLSKAKQVKVTGVLGAGSYGNVFKVQDTSNGNNYALKHIMLYKYKTNEELVKNAMKIAKEAEINLPSEYIVNAYGLKQLDKDGLNFGILFEYADGIDLDEWIRKNQTTSLQIKLDLFCKILEGVDVAHQCGIYHKDIKPPNIKIVEGNNPKILDFGLASVQDKNLTQTKDILGTMSYLAPDSMFGIKSNSQKIDIYALGCLLYELIRGDSYLKICNFDQIPIISPIVQQNGNLTGNNILNFDTSFPEHDDEQKQIANIIRKATTFNPEYRYNTVSEMIVDFNDGNVEHIYFRERFQIHKAQTYDIKAPKLIFIPTPEFNLQANFSKIKEIKQIKQLPTPNFPSFTTPNINVNTDLAKKINGNFQLTTGKKIKLLQKMKENYEWTKNILEKSNYQLSFDDYVVHKIYGWGVQLRAFFSKKTK